MPTKESPASNMFVMGQAFYDAARWYCHVIEGHSLVERRVLVQKAHESLAAVYHYALLLPEVECTGRKSKEPIQPAQWRRLFENLQGHLGEWSLYWDVFNPAEAKADTPPICSNLADDLADIYRDLKRGMVAWEKGTEAAKQRALWEWRLAFWSHTGQHINGALRALFWRLYEGIDDESLAAL